MISNEDKETLSKLKVTQPDIYELFERIEKDHKDHVSIASHNIKNIISTMGSSFQFIEMKYPETKNFKFWTELGRSIKFLVEFMEQTSLYRHSHNAQKTPTNIEDILYTIPECMDEIFEEENRNFNFEIDSSLPLINVDPKTIKYALIELVKNAFEASKDEDTITLGAHVDSDSSTMTLSVSNNGFDIDSDVSSKINTPFYSTKPNHTGMGIAIAEEVSFSHNGTFNILSLNGITTSYINLPLSSE